MNNSYASKVLVSLNHKVSKVASQAKQLELVEDVNSNFIRRSKLGLEKTVNILLGNNSTTLNNELERFYESNINGTVSSSALIQARDKIKIELFDNIFKSVNNAYPCLKTYKDYRLLAIDGSDVPIFFDKNDLDTYHSGKPKKSGEAGKPYSMFHLNGEYDVLNKRFVDYIIQGEAKADEREAFKALFDRYDGDKAIYIADRGYEQSNLFELLNTSNTDNKYVIRIKDINSPGSLFKYHNFKDEEFDLDVDITFTNFNRKEYVNQRDKYKIINQSIQQFDFLDENNHFYNTTWRIVRVKKDINKDDYDDDKDDYVLLVTNLDRNIFDATDVKYIYKLRWQIEIAYKYLKRSLGLINFLSKKRKFIKQEIICKLIMYNIGSIIDVYLDEKRINKHKRKLDNKINFDYLLHKIMNIYYLSKRKGGIPPNLDETISSKTSPIRLGRSFVRNTTSCGYKSFAYRNY